MIYTVKIKINGTVITTEEKACSESEAKSRVKNRYKDQKVENIQVIK